MAEVEKLRSRLDKLEKLYTSSEKARIRCAKNLNTAKEKIRRLEKTVSTDKLNESLSKILNEGLISILTQGYKRVPRWCNKTFLNAYKLRFACGTSGYEEISRQGFKFPCVRTLTTKMENQKFKSSEPIYEIFEFLKIKSSHFEKDTHRDEMAITPGSHYDTSTHQFVGSNTLLGH